MRCTAADVRPSRVGGRHLHAVVTFQLAGEVLAEHGGLLAYRPGDLHLIPAGAHHRVAAAEDAQLWALAIHPGDLDEERFAPLLAPFARVSAGALPRIAVPEGRRSFVDSLFSELASLDASAGDAAQLHSRTRSLRREGLVTLLLSEVAEHANDASPALAFPAALDELAARRGSDVTAEALAFIAAHALSSISLADVARALHRSRSHVADVVRRDTGRSVGDWIAEVRLADACRRLVETGELVEIIAERVGYSDSTHFARTFKRRFGLGPRAWRQRAAALTR
jgi:AraC-like DNA-binding protein